MGYDSKVYTMRYIVVFSEAKTGGREVARNLTDSLDLIHVRIRSNTNQDTLQKTIDIVRGIYRISRLLILSSKNDTFIFEGLVPALLTILKPFVKARLITRIGRVYTGIDGLVFFLPHLMSDRIVAPSHITLTRIKEFKLYQILKIPEKAVVCPNPVASQYHGVEKIEPRDGKPKLLVVGRAHRSKRLDLSLQVCSKIAELFNNNVEVTLVTNKLERETEDVFNSLRCIKKHLDIVADMSSIYPECNLLINCGLNEGFSMISFEAAEYRIPTISFAGRSAQNEFIYSSTLDGIIIEDISDLTIPIINELLMNGASSPELENLERLNSAYC